MIRSAVLASSVVLFVGLLSPAHASAVVSVDGACCFPDCSCQVLTEDECIALDGTYLGDGVSCTPNPCDCHLGACCLVDGTCLELLEIDCEEVEGTWTDWGVPCDPNPCVPAEVSDHPETKESWGRIKSRYRD